MLQIVTNRSNKLKNIHKIIYSITVCILLNSCATTEQQIDTPVQTPKVSHQITIEPQKGRISPEISISRNIKYNLNAIKQHSIDKVLGQQALDNAFNNLKKIKENSDNGASVALKELDFSILYASLNYQQDSQSIDNILNQFISQNLTQGALKTHSQALYANKKIFAIRRRLRQYQKQLTVLIKKQKSLGNFDIEYKKTLENSIDKLKSMQQELENIIDDFKQLTKIDNKKIELNGQKFFADLTADNKTSAEDYQTMALRHRTELLNFTPDNLENISKLIKSDYSNNDSSIKGFYLQDATYLQNLAINSDSQAAKLLQITLDYQKASSHKKIKLKEKLATELKKAIYLQIELAYALAVRASNDYQAQQINLRDLKQTIKKLEKQHNLNTTQKIQLLQLHISLLENENIANQILSEKATTSAALKFYSGQIKITTDLLSKDISALSQSLKQALLQKIPNTKNSSHPNIEEETSFILQRNHWAQSENWLEELMSTPTKYPSTVKSKTNKTKAKHHTIMQLGAYLEKSTAEQEWQKISSILPELKKYTPMYETTYITGIKLIRLYIKSPTGGLSELCKQLRLHNLECILRD